MRTLTTAALTAALILTPTAALATPGHDPVTICHKPGTPAEHEITIDRDALEKHLEHGDAVGACEVVTIPTPVPTTEPTTQPTTEPTEEPTWEPTAPPTETPSPEPVNPEPKPNDEPTPVQPGTPTEHGSEESTPGLPTETNSSVTTATPSASPTPTSETLGAPLKTSAPPSSTASSTTTPRPELAETGFNRGLLALGISLIAAGALSFMGSRQWVRKERKS